MPNRLAHEPSPYLQQHKDNPVDWWPWTDDAIATAREQDKPMFVSIGYSACHWCHVMAHESFEHPEIAAFMNEHFVNVKVDREERPDVDSVFMASVQAMIGHGGWPLNVFATPDGVPFFGGTYWPPVDARGMPGFVRVLETIATAWQKDREQLLENANRVSSYLEDISRVRPASGLVKPSLADTALEKLAGSFDRTWGGFGDAPKFPQNSTLDFLARHTQRTGSAQARTMLATTLDRIADGGIHDHLEGGFARYSVDAEWVVPHFEKMLYDNAQMMRTYLDAWKATGTSRYLDVVRHTGDWLLREMRQPDGGFASALDADSEGVEGKFYVWSEGEIDSLLPNDVAEVVKRRFGITPQGNFEGNTVLTIAMSIGDIATAVDLPEDRVQDLLDRGIETMRERRATRVRPGQDDKVVTAWNGLTITALAIAGAVMDESRFIDAARTTADFLMRDVQKPDGTLWRTWKDGERRGNGVLEDYAFLAEGLIHLHQATGEPSYLTESERLMHIAVDRLSREGAPDFYDTPAEGTGLTVRAHTLQDNATPAGNSVAADVLLTLGELTGRSEYSERAANIVSMASDLMHEHPAAFGRYLAVAERLYTTPYTLVLAGDPASSQHHTLTQHALAHPQPAMITVHAALDMDDAVLQRFPVLKERTPVNQHSTAWLCRHGACMLPATTVDEMDERLREMDTTLLRETLPSN